MSNKVNVYDSLPMMAYQKELLVVDWWMLGKPVVRGTKKRRTKLFTIISYHTKQNKRD